MAVSRSHLVILPTFNTGPRLCGVVAEALRAWQPVLVVVDGSTDGSGEPLRELARAEPGLSVLGLPRNGGKGAAVLAGLEAARDRGFSHALVMDADGQHPAASIGPFMALSMARPLAMILGRPDFGPDAPAVRLHGRKVSVLLARVETLGPAIADPLCGFRVYPIGPLLAALGSRRGGRRYDFDTEAAVRLFWAGVEPVTAAVPVRYFTRAEGGVSHFRYGRDNLVLAALHARLLLELLLIRWPEVIRRRRRLALAILMVALAGASPGRAEERPVQPAAVQLLAPRAPAWERLASAVRGAAAISADFTESRWYSFRRTPVVLRGEVRVSAERGLSLRYLGPGAPTVIIDARGVLIRSDAGDAVPGPDARAVAAAAALLQVLRLDLPSLGASYRIYGRQSGAAWTLVLVPRDGNLLRGQGSITVEGAGPAVRGIEFRSSPTRRVGIVIGPPRSAAGFSAADMHRFFR